MTPGEGEAHVRFRNEKETLRQSMRFTTDQVFKRSAVGAGLKIDPASHDEAEAKAE